MLWLLLLTLVVGTLVSMVVGQKFARIEAAGALLRAVRVAEVKAEQAEWARAEALSRRPELWDVLGYRDLLAIDAVLMEDGALLIDEMMCEGQSRDDAMNSKAVFRIDVQREQLRRLANEAALDWMDEI